MLAFWNADMKYGSEPGEFAVMVGGNSRDVQATEFTLKK
jgi:beta-glucosidase